MTNWVGLTIVHKSSRLCESRERVRRWRLVELKTTRATTPSLEARSAQFGRQTLLPASYPETPARKAGVSCCLGLGLETQSPSTVTSARLVRILELYDVKGHEIAPTTLFLCRHHAPKSVLAGERSQAIDDGLDGDGAK
jgi:hypothetical protein